MSLQELITDHASSVFLNTDHFAESVIQHPAGDLTAEAQVPLTANVEYPEPDIRLDHGRDSKQLVKLTIAGSVTCTLKDVWTIDSLTFQTHSIGRPQGGLRVIMALRVELTNRTPGYGAII